MRRGESLKFSDNMFYLCRAKEGAFVTLLAPCGRWVRPHRLRERTQSIWKAARSVSPVRACRAKSHRLQRQLWGRKEERLTPTLRQRAKRNHANPSQQDKRQSTCDSKALQQFALRYSGHISQTCRNSLCLRSYVLCRITRTSNSFFMYEFLQGKSKRVQLDFPLLRRPVFLR
jgi:hypothetical protein